MTYNVNPSYPTTSRRGAIAFGVAALAGTLHSLITFYWALGGEGLLWTMGENFLSKFHGIRWVLYPLGVVKTALALGPIILNATGWPWSRISRPLCWLVGAGLTVWGGISASVSGAALVGLIHPEGGVNRAAMIGHAAIWDPLFIVWGAGLLAGLHRSRSSVNSAKAH